MKHFKLFILAVLYFAICLQIPAKASGSFTEPPEIVGQGRDAGFFVQAPGYALELAAQSRQFAAPLLDMPNAQLAQYVEIPTLCVIYTNYYHNPDCRMNLTDDEVEQVKAEIEKARRFFWRASYLKCDMKIDFMIIGDDPGERTITPDQMWDWGNGAYWLPFWRCDNVHSVQDDLYNAGIVDGQYAVILVSYAFVNCDTAYAPIGGGTYGPDMGCMGDAAFIADPMAWGLDVEGVTIHEYLHALDGIYQASGNPLDNDMFHADQAEDFPFPVDCGLEFNFKICQILDPNSWLLLNPAWAELQVLPDTDEDGIPDEGPVPITETSLITSPNDVDSDDDGLSDFEEMFASYHGESDPLVKDTDSDGLVDGNDTYPLWNCNESVDKGIPTIDGVISPGEYTQTTVYNEGDPDLGVTVYTRWSEGVFFVAAKITDEMLSVYYDDPWWVDNLQIRIDAQKDGWAFFHGDQNYRFYVVPRGEQNIPDIFAHNHYKDEPNDPWHPIETSAVEAMYVLEEDGYVIELSIPESIVPGVIFAAGESIRLTFDVEDFDEWPGWPSYNLMSKLDDDRPGFLLLYLKQ